MGLQGNGNYLEGYCTISYEIKICAFVKISVSMSMYKRIYGCPDNSTSNNTSNPSQNLVANTNSLLGNGMTLKHSNSTTNNSATQNMDIKRNQFKYSESEWDEFFESNFNKQ
nr:hypothetical protein [Bacteroidota bacterium]